MDPGKLSGVNIEDLRRVIARSIIHNDPLYRANRLLENRADRSFYVLLFVLYRRNDVVLPDLLLTLRHNNFARMYFDAYCSPCSQLYPPSSFAWKNRLSSRELTGKRLRKNLSSW